MNQNVWFKKKLLASAVASCALSGLSGVTMAQENAMLEEVVVTGIRGSMMRAMDIKRDAAGVVDAISAEDIGKFPDTNLAESLQRITGVSIDRRGGEGAEVTVRGFGGGNNLVTLNGRHMPAADVQLGDFSEGTSRSFNFANLASEAVSGIEVYKTGRASIPTGGIGATINIKTTRPLDDPGLRFSVGAKAVHDTTVMEGDEITPEVSGLISWTDANEMFGVALTTSYQKRDSGGVSSTVNDWRLNPWEEGDSLPIESDGAGATNAPQPGELYSLPNDLRYHFEDRERERTNAQLTLQFRPMDNLTLTGDYTYAENDLRQQRGDMTTWFEQSYDAIVFDDSDVTKTSIMVLEDIDDPETDVVETKDTGFEQQLRHMTNELQSFGFNADWQVSDRFNVALDVHDSSMESNPSAPGGSSSITFSMAAPVVVNQQAYYNDGLPIQTFDVYDEARGNGNGIIDSGDLGTQIQRFFHSQQTNDITQIQLDAGWEFDTGRFDFGVSSRSMEMTQSFKQNQQTLGDWAINDVGGIPEDLYEQFCLTCEFEDHDTTGTSQVAFRGDAGELARWGAEEYGHEFGPDIETSLDQNHEITEDTRAAYFQFNMTGELGGMETNMVAGLRYEATDVESISYVNLPEAVRWQDNNDFFIDRTATVEPFAREADYDSLLPSFDFDINLMDDLKGRFSFSETIARPGYTDLRAAQNPSAPSGPVLLGNRADASQGNPGLVPLQSTNFDISLEWYFDDASYASVGVFEKRVRNFIGTEQVNTDMFDLRDPTSGPRAEEAYAAIEARDDHDGVVNETELFVMTAILSNPDDFPGGAADYTPNATVESGGEEVPFNQWVGTNYDVIASADDPLFTFQTSTPTNQQEATITGMELAVQHFFGDTGFGVQANYTVVDSDVGYDNSAPPTEDQFAIPGLSDTANVVLMYENFGLSARLAYNWRDQFLAATSAGSFTNPLYTEAYSQIDMNLSYDVTDNIAVTFEGLNLTGENFRQHMRTENQMWTLVEQGPRFMLGARYSF